VPKAVIPATVFGKYLMIEFKPFKLLDRPLHQYNRSHGVLMGTSKYVDARR